MKIIVDKNKIPIGIEIENDRDFSNVGELEKTLQSKGWKFLAEAFINFNRGYNAKFKETIATNNETLISIQRQARWAGFDDCCMLPEKIMLAAEVYRKKKESELEEKQNEGTDAGD